MEITLFILLFVTGVVVFFSGTRYNQFDISNTYQVILSFLSVVIWIGLAWSSWNIEIYSADTATVNSHADYAYFGISLVFFILSVMNTLVLFFYGSFNALFKLQQPNWSDKH